MNFASPSFALFLAVSLAAFYLARARPTARLLVHTLAGYVFYASFQLRIAGEAKNVGDVLSGASFSFDFDPAFLFLLLFVTALDYTLSRAMARAGAGRRRALVAASVVVDLALLGAFKYLDFFGESLASLASFAGVGFAYEPKNLPLPIGISFYIFQSLSYTIDVYRGARGPASSLASYAAYLAFFPRLVAGPIARADDLIPQLESRAGATRQDVSLAIFLLLSGFIKKIAIADYLRENIVDRVFDFPAMYQTAELVAASFAYTLQIYGDFAGYTDIALGLALLYSIRLPENFDFPYRAASPREFWHRWHITLSTWLRDYLYISLGGKRVRPWKLYRNLMITMVLGGLWHGAGWNFVAWGALHGVALCAHRPWSEWRRRRGKPEPRGVSLALRVFATFLFVNFAWIFFRADDWGIVGDFFRQLTTLTFGMTNVSAPVLAVMAVAMAGMWCPPAWYVRFRDAFCRMPIAVQLLIAAAGGFAIWKLSAAGLAPFVYEKF
ncbi:MBOAT family protein [bacterium]|nr:MBOAT family protein [bacterium]